MKKVFALIFCLILTLLPLGCTSNTGTAPAPSAKAAATTAPAETAPAKVTPVPAVSADLTGKVLFAPEDLDFLNALWPLETCAMTDIGQPVSVDVSISGNTYSYTVRLTSDKSVAELKKSLSDYIDGDWMGDDTAAYTMNSKAEDLDMNCAVQDVGDVRNIDLSFYLKNSFDEVSALIDSHWPSDALQWPDALQSAAPSSRGLYAGDDEHYVVRQWKPDNASDVFAWFQQAYGTYEDYQLIPADSENNECLLFTSAGLHVQVSHDATSVSVKFSATPAE